MPKYRVMMPITGFVCLEVEAPSRAAAVEAFYDNVVGVPSDELDMEWEFTEHVATGNVTHAMCNDVAVEEVE